MHTRLIHLPLFALLLAAMACSVLGSPTPIPLVTALPTASPAGQTPTGPTPPAAQTSSPVGPTAIGPTPPAGATTTAITATATTPEGVNLSGTGKAEAPGLAFDAQGTLHLVWFDRSARDKVDLFHRQKPANGDWSKAETLTTDFDTVFGDMSLIRDQGGNICAIFTALKTRGEPGTMGLYQRCQAGTTWSPATKFTFTQQTGIAVRGYSPARGPDGTIHAAYIIDVGTIYFDDVQLSTDSTALGPSLAIDKAGGYHVTWARLGTATSPSTLEYRFSSDQGKTWQDAQTLSTDKNAPGGGVTHLLADDAGNVHLVWGGIDGADYYRRWTPTGGWGAPAALAGDQAGPNPALAVDAQGLARVVWERFDGLPYVVQSAGGTWIAPRAISHLQSGAPQIAIDAAGASHVVWLSNKDVYYLAVP